jgi:hypothetical protein
VRSAGVLPLVVLAALGACDTSNGSSAPATTTAEVPRTVAAASTKPASGPPDCSQGTELASVVLQFEDEVRVFETADHGYLCLVGSDAEPLTIAFTDRSVAAPEEVGSGPLGNSGWYHLFALPNDFPDVSVFDETGTPLNAVASSERSHLVVLDHTVRGSPPTIVERRWSVVGADGAQVTQLVVQGPPRGSVPPAVAAPLSPGDPLQILLCLRNEGLNLADPPSFGPDGVPIPATVPAGSPPRDLQPFAPERARAAWANCRDFQIAALAGPGRTSEQTEQIMSLLDCMAEQGWIQAFGDPDADTEAHNTAMTACGAGRPVGQITMTCDAYSIDDAGVIAPTPVRSGGAGFFTVATARLPDPIAVGERFTVEVPSVSLPLASRVENFTVISMSDFVHVIHVTGSIVIPDSVVVHSAVPQPPPDPADVGPSTVTLRFVVEAAGGSEIAFPEASFDAVAGAVGTSIEVSLVHFENTLLLQGPDGTTVSIRSMCTPATNVLAGTTVTE